MLGINFLKPNSPLNFAGMEFMDYPSSDLFPKLTKFFEDNIVKGVTSGLKVDMLDVTKDSVKECHDIIFAATGIKTLLSANKDIGNAGVDVGHLSPYNLLNTRILDEIKDKENTNVARAMKIIKTDLLKGWVDTSTGRVGGDYSKIEFTLLINPKIDEIVSNKIVERMGCTMAQALAQAFIHELGHVFSGLLYVTRCAFDAILPAVAINAINKEKAYGKQRATIINDALKGMDIPPAARVEDVDKMDDDSLVVYFSKAISNRDMHRTLSLGTADRGSEVLADLYAVRMGCPKAMVALVAGMEAGISPKGLIATAGVTILFALTGTAMLAGSGALIMSGTLLLHAAGILVPNGMYDSPYRRMKNVLRDLVVRLNEDKVLDKRQKVKLLADAKEMEKNVEDTKKFFEGTRVQRVFGYILSGTDFRAQEFEHYTDELIGHTLSLYKETF